MSEKQQADGRPKLARLDVHGIDDDGVYHAPSRERYAEMVATEDALAARVVEVLATNTRIEDERRKYKALHHAARTLLMELLVDVPLMNRLSNADPLMERVIAHDLPMFAELHERNELLEADAWCGAASLAREFVTAATKAAGDDEREGGSDYRDSCIAEFVERFRKILAR